MEEFIQVIVFLVIVVASIWSEVNKSKSGGKTDAEFGDLTAIDDFFKQQEKARKPEQPRVAPESFDSNAVSLEQPQQAVSRNVPGMPRKVQSQREPARKQKKEKKHGRGRDQAGLDQSGRQPPPLPSLSSQSHFGAVDSDEGPCLDEAPTLFGKTSYEQGEISIARTASTTDAVTRKPTRRWSRNQLIDAIVISELMNRYDVNRVYARIPDRRS